MAAWLYLVRHGEAKSAQVDPDRSLTEWGSQDVARVATFAAAAGFAPNEIRHSGKMRAQQTAEIMARHLSLPALPTATSGLSPNDDVHPVADSLAQKSGSMMLVGHLPFLDRLTSLLVTGKPDLSIVQFEAATLVALSRSGSDWTIACAVQPALIR